jgi:hypothetical protein
MIRDPSSRAIINLPLAASGAGFLADDCSRSSRMFYERSEPTLSPESLGLHHLSPDTFWDRFEEAIATRGLPVAPSLSSRCGVGEGADPEVMLRRNYNETLLLQPSRPI